MSSSAGNDLDAAARARSWRNSAHTRVCDSIEPWAHGTVVRAAKYPSYYDFNAVRVEDEPAMGADELVAFADHALAGLAHRRVDFDLLDPAERLRPEFEARNFTATSLVWMRHEAGLPDGPQVAVEEVPYDAVRGLRVTWHREQFDGDDPSAYLDQSREVALGRDAMVLAVIEGGEPVAYAQLERDGPGAEVPQVYVHPDWRGAGRGTAITRAAIAAAGDVEDLWIVADAEGRPKDLYARLGFRPAWRTMEFQRAPGDPG